MTVGLDDYDTDGESVSLGKKHPRDINAQLDSFNFSDGEGLDDLGEGDNYVIMAAGGHKKARHEEENQQGAPGGDDLAILLDDVVNELNLSYDIPIYTGRNSPPLQNVPQQENEQGWFDDMDDELRGLLEELRAENDDLPFDQLNNEQGARQLVRTFIHNIFKPEMVGRWHVVPDEAKAGNYFYEAGSYYRATYFTRVLRAAAKQIPAIVSIKPKGCAIVIEGSGQGLEALAMRLGGDGQFKAPVARPDEDRGAWRRATVMTQPFARNGKRGAGLFQGENAAKWRRCDEGFFFPANSYGEAGGIVTNLNCAEAEEVSITQNGSAVIVAGSFAAGLQILAHDKCGETAFAEPSSRDDALYKRASEEKMPFFKDGKYGAKLFQRENAAKWRRCDEGFFFPAGSSREANDIANNLRRAEVISDDLINKRKENTVIVKGNFAAGLKVLAHGACGVTTFGEPGLNEQGAEATQPLNVAQLTTIADDMGSLPSAGRRRVRPITSSLEIDDSSPPKRTRFAAPEEEFNDLDEEILHEALEEVPASERGHPEGITNEEARQQGSSGEVEHNGENDLDEQPGSAGSNGNSVRAIFSPKMADKWHVVPKKEAVGNFFYETHNGQQAGDFVGVLKTVAQQIQASVSIKRNGRVIIVEGSAQGLEALAMRLGGDGQFKAPVARQNEDRRAWRRATVMMKPFARNGKLGAGLFQGENADKWLCCDEGFFFPMDSLWEASKVVTNLNRAEAGVEITPIGRAVIVTGGFAAGLQILAHDKCGEKDFREPTSRNDALYEQLTGEKITRSFIRNGKYGDGLFLGKNAAKWRPCKNGFSFAADSYNEAGSIVDNLRCANVSIKRKDNTVTVVGTFAAGLGLVADKCGISDFPDPGLREDAPAGNDQAAGKKATMPFYLKGKAGAKLFRGENAAKWRCCDEGFFFPADSYKEADRIASNLRRAKVISRDLIKHTGSAVIVKGDFAAGLKVLAHEACGVTTFGEPTLRDDDLYKRLTATKYQNSTKQLQEESVNPEPESEGNNREVYEQGARKENAQALNRTLPDSMVNGMMAIDWQPLSGKGMDVRGALSPGPNAFSRLVRYNFPTDTPLRPA